MIRLIIHLLGETEGRTASWKMNDRIFHRKTHQKLTPNLIKSLTKIQK